MLSRVLLELFEVIGKPPFGGFFFLGIIAMLSFTSNEILAVVIAASFAARLNVYATVVTLGLLSHAQAFQLPPALHMLESWPVIVYALCFSDSSSSPTKSPSSTCSGTR